ncbi:site-specific integrase [Arthrobacter sp. 9MFCol3.1]|uniref:site-specific integrase n=1 Tax=Arthrobacter sp. 9MFCol3.1 TaxID=1150398 RepID=UPI0018CC6591|nr:site-specific integrase [Arthrobacter sp. 9MFCol3.1]
MTSVNFASFALPWQGAVKRYFWTLINEDEPRLLAAAKVGLRPSLRTISAIKAPLARLFSWVEREGIHHFGQLGGAHLDAFLAHMGSTDLSYDSKQDTISEVRRLWAYRGFVDPLIALPDSPPWSDAPARDLLGPRAPIDSANRTPRIAESTLVPLIGWAVRFVDDVAPDILANYREFREIVGNAPRRQRSGIAQSSSENNRHAQSSSENNRKERLTRVLGDLSQAGLGVPGRVELDGTRTVRWGYLGRLTHSTGQSHSTYDQEIVKGSGLPIDDDAYLMAGCRILIDGTPWHDGPMKYDQAASHANLLLAACFIVVSYLSGMRPGEVLTLRPGCLSSDPETGRLTITGTRWKGATDETGSKSPEGARREVPWVVHPVVARAVAALEELHEHAFLFPKDIRPRSSYKKDQAIAPRAGQAKTSSQMAVGIERFVSWVNAFCEKHHRSDRIPDDPNGLLSPSRFRRTLAWHIVRKPRGLVAAAIQYGHVNVQITKGYAGNYDSGFPDDIAFEQWLERLDRIRDLEEYIDSGGTVSGAAAGELERRVRETQSKYAGRVIHTGRQAEKLLRDPVLQIFPGNAVHCVFDRAKALCIAENQDAPSLGECRRGCQNIARTDGDIATLEETLKGLPDETLAPRIRHLRIASVRQNINGIIADHEEGTP